MLKKIIVIITTILLLNFANLNSQSYSKSITENTISLYFSDMMVAKKLNNNFFSQIDYGEAILIADSSALKIKFATIDNDFNVLISQNSIEYSINSNSDKIQSLATFRNLFLWEIQFKADDLEIGNNDLVLKLNLGKNFEVVQNNQLFYAFANDIINGEHINSMLNSAILYKKDASKFESKSTWYSANTKYAKISTSKDGIASFDLAAIAQILDITNPAEYQNLKLENRGVEVPIHINQSDNTAYFMGCRPKGDTTHFNVFSNFEVFYLSIDKSSPRLRFENIQNLDTNLLLSKKVKFDQHIEIDKDYGYGTDILETETTQNEGYYWQVLQPNQSFNYTLPLNLTGAREDSISIRVKYANWMSTVKKIYNKLEFSFNEDLLETLEINTDREAGYFSVNRTQDELANTENFLKIFNKRTIFDSDTLTMHSDIGIDYISISGNMAPLSQNNELAFKSSLQTPNRVEVYGFTSDNIMAIDKANNKLWNSNISKGTTFKASMDPLFQLQIEIDGIKLSQKVDSPYAIITTDGNTVNVMRFNTYEQFIVQYNGLDKNRPYGIILNNITLREDFRIALLHKGSKEYTKINATTNYIAFLNRDIIYENVVRLTIDKFLNLNGFIKNQAGKTYSIEIEVGESSEIFVADNSRFENAIIETINSSNLTAFLNKYDLLYITHSSLIEATKRYADSRKIYNGLQYAIYDIEDIYKEFNYGNKSPHAIKDFIKYSLEEWSSPPRFVMLVGDANRDNRNVLPNSFVQDFVPTYGNPVSDTWFSMTNLPFNHAPTVYLGRLPVKDAQQIDDFRIKMEEYEQAQMRPWQKRTLFLSGGTKPEEIVSFFGAREPFFDNVTRLYNLCADTVSIQKSDGGIIGESDAGRIRRAINEGAFWTTYFGHASAGNFDMDGWQVETLNNKGRYGIFSSISCNTSAFAEPDFQFSRNEEYLLASDRGFVVSMGSTATGNTSDMAIAYGMSGSFAHPDLKMRNISQIMNRGKSALEFNIPFGRSATFCYTLLGDPTLMLRIDTIPQPYVLDTEIFVTDEDNNVLITEESTKAIVNLKIRNAGIGLEEPYKIRVYKRFGTNIDSIDVQLNGLCLFEDVKVEFDIESQIGKHSFEVVFDINNETEIANINSKSLIKASFEVFATSPLALEPHPYWDVNAQNPMFRIINPLRNNSAYSYQMIVSENKDTTEIVIGAGGGDRLFVKENYIEWSPRTNLTPNKSYWFRARQIDSEGKISSWLWVPFTTISGNISSIVSTDFTNDNISNEMAVDNMMLNAENGKINASLKVHKVDYEIYSVAGGDTNGNNYDRYIRMNLTIDGNIVVLADGPFIRGFNVVLMSKTDITKPKIYRRFDSYMSGGVSKGEASKLVRFLRDSVSTDDYVMIGVCDRGVHEALFIPTDSIGYIDSLKATLRSLGSALADSLDWGSSFAMVGQIGAEVGSIPEAWTHVAPAHIVSTLDVFETKGSISTPYFGPANDWLEFAPKIENREGTNIEMTVKGMSFNSTERILYQGNLEDFDITTIDAKQTPLLKIDFDFEKEQLTSNPVFTGITTSFEAPIELAFINSEIWFDKVEYLRGETARFNLSLENISHRQITDSVEVVIQNTNNTAIPAVTEFINRLEPNLRSTLTFDFNTTNMELITPYSLRLQPVRDNEVYLFNNIASSQLRIYEDTIKPTIKVYIDSVEVQDGDYVSLKPEIFVEIYDNSPLNIENPNSITVRVNGFVLQSTQNSELYEFKSVADGGSLKATLRCRWDQEFTFGNVNRVRVSAFDASLNRADDYELNLNVSLNGFFEFNVHYPNPTSNTLTVDYQYKGPELEVEALLEIYDLQGKQVASTESKARLGNNKITWDGMLSGTTLPSQSIFFYKLSSKSEFYIEPIIGKFVYIR